MTYVEFFDENDAENICACLISAPDRVIFVGNSNRKMRAHAERYRRIFENRGVNIEFLCRSVVSNDLNAIVDLLSGIVEEYPDCVFDLTGGGDLFLVAIGIVYHRYRDMDLQLHRVNLLNNRLYDCDCDGKTIAVNSLPQLTAEENVLLHGGSVVYEDERKGATVRWDWTEEFKNDIRAMWQICRRDVRAWNAQIGVFAAIDSAGTHSALTSSAYRDAASDFLKSAGAKFKMIPHILRNLENAGLADVKETGDGCVDLTFKNEQIKKCLTKAGLVLEMIITLTAAELVGSDGEPVYNDVVNGAFLDWDGDIRPEKDGFNTENEIDVLMMHEMIPVFVSCKNGAFDVDELYKLCSVAAQFGGKYAKMVLIATALDKNNPAAGYIRRRAADMGVRLVENPQDMTSGELCRAIGALWRV